MRLIIFIFLILNLYAGDSAFEAKTIKVKKVDYLPSREFYGVSEVDESGINDFVLRTDGYIKDVKASKKYSYVKKGDELFTLYSPQIYMAASELLNTIESKHDGLRESVITKLRLLGVNESVINEIIESKKIKEYIPFYSNNDGFIIEKTISDGSGVKTGALLYKIADYKKIWVVARVYESDLEFVKKGMSAKIRFDGNEKIYDSKVEFIYPYIKDKSANIRIVIENKNLDIYPGSFAKIALFGKAKTILMLPKTAVITKGDNYYVFVAGEYEGEYEPKKITAKRIDSKSFEIKSGLKEGDSVIDNALFLFDSDAQINGLY